MISLSLLLISTLASRFKLRFRVLTENLPARTAVLMMNATATLIMSIFLVIAFALKYVYAYFEAIEKCCYRN